MRPSPLRRGTGLALLAAVSFGATAPFLSRLGAGASSFAVAALLYAGAALLAGVLSSAPHEAGRDAPLRRAHVPRVVAVALLGAGVAPVAFAWGIARTGAASGSLLLNMEAIFTVLLARAIYCEPIGRRVGAALVVMAIGGASLTVATARSPSFDAWGVAAIVVATSAWAADNTLTRKLADVRPLAVVFAKAGLGAAVTATVASLTRARWPSLPACAGLLVCGAVGYGGSLVLYLRAQRLIGAGRTGSVFALAPFVGAALGLGVDRIAPSAVMGVGAGLFALGVYLHATEKHAHRHRHVAEEHEHAHRHDDGHHEHEHEFPVVGEHSHVHAHEEREHEHEHGPDLHHGHRHD